MRAFPMAPPLLSDDDDDETVLAPRARRRAGTYEPVPAEEAALASRAMACGVDEVMRPLPPTVVAEGSIAVVRELLLARRVRAVPVVDRDGRPIGVVTAADLLRGPTTGSVAEVMTHNVLALPITAILTQAAALIAYEGVSEIVIVDLHGRVAGLLGALDITRWCARAAGYLVDH